MQILLCEIGVAVFDNGLASAARQLQQQVGVVDGNQCSCQHFFGNDEMAQIGARKMPAGVAAAGFLNRAVIGGMAGVD